VFSCGALLIGLMMLRAVLREDVGICDLLPAAEG